MRIGTNDFRGELPHLAPEALPDQAAQVAINCRMETGNLQPFKQFAQTKVLANTGTVQTIFLAQHPTTSANAWLSFNEDVDIARNVVEDDPDGLLLLTCPELFDTPVYTTYAAATTGAEPFPVAGSLLPLGVPGPTDVPVLLVGPDTTPTTYSIDELDEGDKFQTAWVASSNNFGNNGTFAIAEQVNSSGNPQPCYRLTYNETHNAGEEPHIARNFSIGDAAVVHASVDIFFGGDTSQTRAGFLVACSAEGVGVMVWFEEGSLQIRNATQFSPYTAAVVATTSASLAAGVWHTLDVNIVVNDDGTQTVTARALTGATEVATVTGTAVFSLGDYCALTAASVSDAGLFITDFDNIHVQASGSTGVVPRLTSTAYVYTFVNNRGWESVPSLPTANVLRPDGVQITVTTSTTAPAGYSAVTLKRIYRLVQALTGDLFLLVAEIPLAQADFVDNLADNQIGPDELLSQNFDLPPAGMRGIMALPSGAYSGFVGKQLCISAAGWPHAWPLQQRHSCEFNIVATGKVGNTIVVGTEGRAYTCTGTEPGNYVMSEPGESQACVSKRGMVFLDGQGVAFPSPDGYQLCSGSAGNLRNLTETIFTRQQWREKNPASIIGAVHDGVLHWYWKTASTAAGTVLFLFHFTEATSDEGVPEFTSLYGAMDQTNALWTASSTNWIPLAFSSPAPKFGALFMRAGIGGSVTWTRNASQDDPVPDTVAIGSNTAITIDAWVYRRSAASGAFQIRIGSSYPDYFVLSADEFGTYAQMWGASIFLSVPIITADQWVHLRLTYDGDVLRLFVDGVLSASSSSTPGLLATIDPISTMQFTLESFSDGGFMCDEIYAALSTSVSSANFTPPGAPWPNP